MKKTLNYLLCSLFILPMVLGLAMGTADLALADPVPSTPGATVNPLDNLKKVGDQSGLKTPQGGLIQLIGNIIKIILGILAVIFIVLFFYAGFTYMTAAGDADKTKTAIATMRNAIIGVAIIFAAWAISDFVINNLFLAASGTGVVGVTPTPT